MQPRVVSVQVGGVRVLGSSGAVDAIDRLWSSAIFKTAVSGRRMAGPLGLDGDEQADREHHGGLDKALLAYSAENLATWTDLLGDVPGGGFGENLTISGLDETSVCIGDRFRIGGAVVECSQARNPCWKLDRRWGQPDLSKFVIENGRCGWYLRVLEAGDIGAGDAVELADRPHPDWSVARAARIMHRMERDPHAAAQLAALPQLAASWRVALEARAAR